MITLKLFYNSRKISEISLYNRLNLVVGNSGGGKTYFIDRVADAENGVEPWSISCEKNVIPIRDMPTLNLALNNAKDSLIIIDEDITSNIIGNGTLFSKLSSSKNYILLLDRALESRINVNIRAIFTVEQHNNILKFEQLYKLIKVEHIDFRDYKWIISEDSKSGRDFWKQVIRKLDFIESIDSGDGGIPKTIKSIMNKYSNGKILVALDYDKGSIAMRNILKLDVDKERISFIDMESLEEVICNSDFILKYKPDLIEKVRNYKEHITCYHRSTGKYFSDLLRTNITEYNPSHTSNKDKFLPFYNKGMDNFGKCFIHDCCDDNKENCFMYFDGDKKRAMLANKFEIYRELI